MNIKNYNQWLLNEEKQNKEFEEFHNIMKMAEPKAPAAVSTYVDAFKTLQRYTKSEKEEILDILSSNIFIEPLKLIINPESVKKDIDYVSELPNESYTKYNHPNIYDIPTNTAKYFVRWFLHAGMSLEGACALSGNLWRESYFNPYQKEMSGGPGRGLAQWTNTVRWTTYTSTFFPSFRASNKLVSSYDLYDLESQLSFVVYELKNNYRGIWRTLLTPGDLYGKAMKVLKKYEVPATKDDPTEEKLRYDLGQKIMNIVQGDNRLKFIANSVEIQKQTKPQLFT
jgi:hypothetical protein